MSPIEVISQAEHATHGDVDLGPLAWVIEELRKSLDSAIKGVRRFARETQEIKESDLAALDTGPLRGAKQQLHQACGALDMVGMPQAALLLRAMESAVQHYVKKPQDCTDAVAQTLEQASFSLLEYLESMLAGKRFPAVALFPQYRDIHSLFENQGKVHPADLWPIERRLREPDLPRQVSPLSYSPEVRKLLDACVLHIVKGADIISASARMREICLGFANFQEDSGMRTFWKVAAAYFDAMAHGLLKLDVYTKRVSSRVLMIFAAITKGDPVAPDRLMQDMLFFCAQAAGSEGLEHAEILHAVYQSFGLQRHVAVDYEQSRFGRFDPVLLVQARKRIAASTEIWSSLAGGDKSKIKPAFDQFTLVCESLQKLHLGSERLSKALMQVMQRVAHDGTPPVPSVAMEVATAVLYLQAAFASLELAEDVMVLHSETLAQRLEGVLAGQEPQPLEAWMEQLYRQVSEQQTMGSVVGELRATLAETEKLLDQYFRNPLDSAPLPAVATHLSQMRGVLSVLGLDQASQAMVHMRQSIEKLQTEQLTEQVQNTLFEKMGNSLGALGFLIDMLSYQRNMARKLYEFDEKEGELKLLMGRTRARANEGLRKASAENIEARIHLEKSVLSDVAFIKPLAAVFASEKNAVVADGALTGPSTDLLSEALPQQEALQVIPLVDADVSTEEASRVAPALAPALLAEPEDTDDELLGIFLEEAREVVSNGRGALQLLVAEPANLSEQTILRRAFHTLKGSSRMVGLDEFGQAGWAMEQMLNAWLAEQKSMPEPMRQLSLQSLDAFELWVAAIEAGTDVAWSSIPFRASADAMRVEMRFIPLDMAVVRGDISHSDVMPPVMSINSLHTDAASDLALEELSIPQEPPSVAYGEMLASGASDTVPDVEHVQKVVVSAQVIMDSPLAVVTLGAERSDSVPSDESLSADCVSPTVHAASVQVMPAEGVDNTVEPVIDDLNASSPAVQEDTEVEFDEFDALLRAAESDISAPIQSSVKTPEEVFTENISAELVSERGVLEEEMRESELTKTIGNLSMPLPLYNVYLEEAESWSYRLLDSLKAWQERPSESQPESAYAWAHSLAGSSATVGFKALSNVSRLLENSLLHVESLGQGIPEHVDVFVQAAQQIRKMLHQFAAGFLDTPEPQLLAQLQQILGSHVDVPTEIDAAPALGVEHVLMIPPDEDALEQSIDDAIARAMSLDDDSDDDIDVFDVIDPDLFPIFEEEAAELLPALGASMRDWANHPTRLEARSMLLRALHTLKGSARLAGAMRLGEMAHRLESALEELDADTVTTEQIEPLFGRLDAIEASFNVLLAVGAQAETEALRVEPTAIAMADVAQTVPLTVETQVSAHELEALAPEAKATQPVSVASTAAALVQPAAPPVAAGVVRQNTQQTVRVRSQLLDRLINEAGEVMIARSRLDERVGSMKTSLGDLSNNLNRLRKQLRDIEVQAESQMQSRMQLSKEAAADFDPLEFDRFTRVQELTRMMAESVNDVATVQRNLQRDVARAEDDLIAQGRQARELQRDLLRTRMVEFDSISERLYAVVRMTSKETGKQVKLGLSGGTIEMDRGVLERMVSAFEHLLRNCVDHGIETPEERKIAGKSPIGTISVHVQQEGNDVAVSFNDDGAGLNIERIREKALNQGLITADEVVDSVRAAQLVFMPGFTTAQQLTGVSGRGIGMDVVRSEVQALGGRIETHTEQGKGSSFRLVLPLTTAVTQVVILRAGELSVGVPASLVEVVRRVSLNDLEAAYRNGELVDGAAHIPFFWAGAVWSQSARSVEAGSGKTRPIIIFRSASQRIALHVDEVLGHQEVVVKNLGPQMSRLPGLTGMSVLPSGAVVLIYNPVALTAVYGDKVRQLGEGLPALLDAQIAKQLQRDKNVASTGITPSSQVPLVMVVDDSITVRRVSQRLLQREGYRVVTAADGLQALEKLQDEVPCVVLSDIEMPRMDGFDLLRNIRAQTQFQRLPIIMITSRIAQKHRDHAMELGANHYLGKPYSDEELMGLVHHYAVGKPLPLTMPGATLRPAAACCGNIVTIESSSCQR